MTEILRRRSPVHQLLEVLQPRWTTIAGMQVALSFTTDDAEQAVLESVGLCDLSCLCKVGFKGPDAGDWLADQGVMLPQEIYASLQLQDGGLIARLGTDEFLLESGIANESVPALEAKPLPLQRRVYRVLRQDATFVLCGQRADGVLSQTCGIDFRDAPLGRVVLTRVAGVSCGILPERLGEHPAYRIWVDASFATSLWESLAEICGELGGGVVGMQVIFPKSV